MFKYDQTVYIIKAHKSKWNSIKWKERVQLEA